MPPCKWLIHFNRVLNSDRRRTKDKFHQKRKKVILTVLLHGCYMYSPIENGEVNAVGNIQNYAIDNAA